MADEIEKLAILGKNIGAQQALRHAVDGLSWRINIPVADLRCDGVVSDFLQDAARDVVRAGAGEQICLGPLQTAVFNLFRICDLREKGYDDYGENDHDGESHHESGACLSES